MNTKRTLTALAALFLAALACNLPAAQQADEPEVIVVEPGETVTVGNGETEAPDEPTNTPELGETPEETEAPTATEASDATTTPRATSRPSDGGAPQHGDEIYSTNFTSGWVEVTSSDGATVRGRATPVEGGLLFEVDPSWGLWVFTQRDDVDTFYAEIDAAPRDCPPGSSNYGLMFQFRDNDNFRAFAVTCSGSYRLYEFSDSGDETLVSGELPGGIDTASGEHRLGVLATGSTLTLYLNDAEVDSVQVEDMPAGDFGPFVDTADEGIAVLFQRLTVYEP